MERPERADYNLHKYSLEMDKYANSLEAEVERLEALAIAQKDMIRFLKEQNQDLNRSCIQWKAENKRLLKRAMEDTDGKS